MPENNEQLVPLTSQRRDWHVAFDLTPAPNHSNDLTPNQHLSPWPHSPSEPLQPLTFDSLMPNVMSSHTPWNASPKDFDYVFQSPLTPSKPPGSVSWNITSRLSAISLTTPHQNHGCCSPQARPHSTQSWSLSSPAGNRHGKGAHDVQPFFNEESGQKSCILCG